MKTILLVEDEESLSTIISDELREEGYEVLTAYTGRECREHLAEVTPDLVIMDIKLPDVSGLQLLDDVRRKSANLPIVISTAFDNYKKDYEVWAAGVSDYMVKPVELDDLKARIKKILGEQYT
ncbi:MAG: response regulator [Elusimicrobia bacterium]|nr:response regulator [Elusimicrobiota bacterium]